MNFFKGRANLMKIPQKLDLPSLAEDWVTEAERSSPMDKTSLMRPYVFNSSVMLSVNNHNLYSGRRMKRFLK